MLLMMDVDLIICAAGLNDAEPRTEQVENLLVLYSWA